MQMRIFVHVFLQCSYAYVCVLIVYMVHYTQTLSYNIVLNFRHVLQGVSPHAVMLPARVALTEQISSQDASAGDVIHHHSNIHITPIIAAAAAVASGGEAESAAQLFARTVSEVQRVGETREMSLQQLCAAASAQLGTFAPWNDTPRSVMILPLSSQAVQRGMCTRSKYLRTQAHTHKLCYQTCIY